MGLKLPLVLLFVPNLVIYSKVTFPDPRYYQHPTLIVHKFFSKLLVSETAQSL